MLRTGWVTAQVGELLRHETDNAVGFHYRQADAILAAAAREIAQAPWTFYTKGVVLDAVTRHLAAQSGDAAQTVVRG